MYGWALRKKLVAANPALGAGPPKVKPSRLKAPTMAAPPGFALYIKLAATVGSRRGSMVALRWGNVDLEAAQITLERAIAESQTGQIEKGTKAEHTYVVSVGASS